MAFTSVTITGPIIAPNGAGPFAAQIIFRMRGFEANAGTLAVPQVVSSPVSGTSITAQLVGSGNAADPVVYDVFYGGLKIGSHLIREIRIGSIALSAGGSFSLANIIVISDDLPSGVDALSRIEAAAAKALAAAAAAEAASDAAASQIIADQRVPTDTDRLALTGLAAGATVYVIDTGHTWQWSGSAWVDLGAGPIGDIVSGATVVGRAAELSGGDGLAVDATTGQATVEVQTGNTEALVIGSATRKILGINTSENRLDVPLAAVEVLTTGQYAPSGDLIAADAGELEQITGKRGWITPDGRGLVIDPVAGEIVTTLTLRQELAPVMREPTPADAPATLVRDLSSGDYSRAGALHTGVATIGKTGSRWWAADWRNNKYAGEASGNYIMIYYSDDDRQNWSEFAAFTYPADDLHKLIDPMFWTNPETGELWLWWSVSYRDATVDGDLSDGAMGVWAAICANPDVADVTRTVWSRPIKMTRFGDPRRVVRMAGAWYIPVDLWRATATSPPMYQPGCTLYRLYPDQRRMEPVGVLPPNSAGAYSGFFETEVIELMDGRWMATCRRLPAQAMTQRCFSADIGKSWSAWEDWPALVSDSSSRIWLGRAASGRMLMINHYQDPNRGDLRAWLSDDDGETFAYTAQVDPVLMSEGFASSYPVAIVSGDEITIVYDILRTNQGSVRVSIMSEVAIIAGTSNPIIHLVSH